MTPLVISGEAEKFDLRLETLGCVTSVAQMLKLTAARMTLARDCSGEGGDEYIMWDEK